MIVGAVNSKITSMLEEIPDIVGYVVASKDGIPYIVNLPFVEKEENKALFATMCATATGSYQVICQILRTVPQVSSKHICFNYGSYHVIISRAHHTQVVVAVVVNSDPNGKIEDILEGILSEIDRSEKVFS